MRDFRRTALLLTIGSFSIAALLGVAALLSGGDFGTGQVRVLLTTLCVGVTSVLALCYLAAAGTPYRLVGALGALAAGPTLVLALFLVWTDTAMDNDAVWQAFGIGSVASATLAQATLLLVLAAGAAAYVRTLLTGTLVAAAWVAVHVSVLIVDADGSDGSLRLLGVVAILDVLGTVAVAALGRFGGTRTSTTSPLVVPDDLARLLRAAAVDRGRTPQELLRTAVLVGLEGQGAIPPRV